MSEWSKEAVLKTVEPQGSVGSNPTISEQEMVGSKRSPRRPTGGKGGRMPPTEGVGGSKEQTRCLRLKTNPTISEQEMKGF